MKFSQHSPLILSVSFALSIFACADDSSSSGQDCPTGEHYDEVTQQCVAIQCPPGSTYNPIQDQCQSDDDGSVVDPVDPQNSDTNTGDTNQSTDPSNQGGDTNQGGDNQSNTNQATNDGSGQPADPEVEPPYDPYEPQDPASADYHSCESDDFDGIPSPRFIHHGAANYLLAAPPEVQASTLLTSQTTLQAHVFEDGDANYAGFIVNLSPPDSATSASASSDWIFDQIASLSDYGATRQGEGRSLLTHDNFSASVLNHVSLDTGDSPAQIRDRLVGSFFGIAPADLEHELDGATSSDGSGAHLVYKTVARTDEDVIVVGAITTANLHAQPDSHARFAVQDLAGGTALAASGETMSDQCISLEIRDTNEVDIIVSLDASGSMHDVNEGLMDFADELVDLLNAADVDWRVAVTGVDCDDIREDEALSPEFRALWPDPDEWEEDNPFGDFFEGLNTPCQSPTDGMFPIPSDGNNGRLMGDFTTDPEEIRNQMSMVSQTGLEYTLTMGIAALDHSLPRADGAGDKLRTHAAPVVIAVTDENEQLFKDAFGNFISGGNDPLNSSQMAELIEFIDPWMSYINRPDLVATISGLYWVPGTQCDGGEDVAHGIHYVVEQTGGVYDSICEPDIGDAFGAIAEATQELVTGLHLVGNPVGHTVAVDVEDLVSGSVDPLQRSIDDGFDFDSTSNSLHFEGPSAPEEDQRVIVPYLTWDGTIIPCSSENQCPGGGKCVKGTCH